MSIGLGRLKAGSEASSCGGAPTHHCCSLGLPLLLSVHARAQVYGGTARGCRALLAGGNAAARCHAAATAAAAACTYGYVSPGACWVQDKFVPTLLAGYAIWVPFNLLSFRLIPQVRVVDDSRGGGQHSGTSAGAGATPVLDPSLCLRAATPPPPLHRTCASWQATQSASPGAPF